MRELTLFYILFILLLLFILYTYLTLYLKFLYFEVMCQLFDDGWCLKSQKIMKRTSQSQFPKA